MSLKKAELHVHLEGSISPALAKKLALRNKIKLPDRLISADGASYIFNDFFEFLKSYDSVASVIKNPADYYDITYDYLKTNALENTIYTEMMYSPEHAELSSGIPSSEHLQAIQQAIDDAEADFNIIARIIITAVRHLGPESALKVATQALKETQPCIVGFGLGGDEINFPPRLFKRAYEIAAGGGLLCTVHAGEFAPASGMNEAMDYLPIQRIGHGIQAIHSPETIARLRDTGIALEVCPSSNIALGLIKDFASHPLPKLKDLGLQLSIGSDDPPFFRSNLPTEYRRIQEAYQYSDNEMNKFTSMAIESSFADRETKLKLHQLITE